MYTGEMNFNSRKAARFILAVTAIVCARMIFVFFDDPEGPNLLIVMGMAAIIYVLSLAAYVGYSSAARTKSGTLLIPALIQILIAVAVAAYFMPPHL